MKTVLITGASSGIGKAAATLMAAQGWNVVASMRDPADGAALGELPNVLVARLDVQDSASIAAAIDAGIARFGRIDALVNNAGYGQNGLFEATSPQAIERQFDVNVFGVMNTIRALLPHMRAQGGGAIVNISSGAGLYTLPLISLYCASKFALEGFTESLSYELASQNIAVKLVIPYSGITGTNFIERAGKDFAMDASLGDYADFLARSQAAFGKMAAARGISAGDVAGRILEALTDGSDRLRYLIGNDNFNFVNARQELPEDDYIAYMRAHFSAA